MGRTYKALPLEIIDRPHFKRLRNIWYGVKHRTSNPEHSAFKNYGARGIDLCERWQVIENFYQDLIFGYSPGFELDRIDNDKGYSPENCRWATPKQQANNRRSSRLITIDGHTKTLAQWIEYRGLDSKIVRNRIYMYKWPIERALGPIKERKIA